MKSVQKKGETSMGTRADFYTRSTAGRLTYRGSIAWDGDPDNIPSYVMGAGDAAAFCHGLYKWFKHDRTDASLPKRDGWPWPWANAYLTDWSYVFDARSGKVEKFKWGKPVGKRGRPYKWPDMSSVQRVTMGSRSGLLVLLGG